jgi:hypothetical protein
VTVVKERVRARVLNVGDGEATLGVYHMGEWLRVKAWTRVALAEGAWLEGSLVLAEDGETIYFKLAEAGGDDAGEPSADWDRDGRRGLDLEA